MPKNSTVSWDVRTKYHELTSGMEQNRLTLITINASVNSTIHLSQRRVNLTPNATAFLNDGLSDH